MRLKTLFVFSFVMLILVMGAVSANENITDNITQSPDNDVFENPVEGDTFKDIQDAVDNADSDSVIELNGTYVSTGSEINVNKNLEFRGGSEGATLDGKKLSGIFKTSQKGYIIILKNINFVNAKKGVFADSDYYSSDGKLFIYNCNFTDNDGEEFGAVSCCEAHVSDSNFINNRAVAKSYGSWGGAINSKYCNATNCNFEKNTASDGGAVCSNNFYADSCSFKENSAKNSGGAVQAEVEIINSIFTSNSVSKGNGGAIDGEGYIENSIFTKNTAYLSGGAVSGNVKVVNSLFDQNTAIYAGAICSPSEAVEIVNTTFKSNNDAAVIAKGITSASPNKKYTGLKAVNNDLNGIDIIKINAKKLSTSYKSGKDLKIKMIRTTSNKPAPYLRVYVEVFKGNKRVKTWLYANAYIYTDSNGITVFKASNLPAGKYKVNIKTGSNDDEYDDDYCVKCPIKTATLTVKISKAKTIVKAPKISAKHKKSNYFKVTVKNKSTKKAVANIKLKVKVFTGKKSKTYKLKTSKKGVAKLNTKRLSRGVHKVIITSKNNNYKISKKSQITIR